jgi:hypothetical protein
MTAKERQALLETLEARFERNMKRHPGPSWADVRARLDAKPKTLKALQAMEATGGDPDVIVIGQHQEGGPSVCYDGAALESRKENKPKTSALQMAAEMGIDLLTEEQYRALQTLGTFDTKTSSWVITPPDVRSLGGALFCDRRFGRVFVYHNGAESYYAARGFRGLLQV